MIRPANGSNERISDVTESDIKAKQKGRYEDDEGKGKRKKSPGLQIALLPETRIFASTDLLEHMLLAYTYNCTCSRIKDHLSTLPYISLR
jgi:hypothetical protein